MLNNLQFGSLTPLALKTSFQEKICCSVCMMIGYTTFIGKMENSGVAYHHAVRYLVSDQHEVARDFEWMFAAEFANGVIHKGCRHNFTSFQPPSLPCPFLVNIPLTFKTIEE